MSMRQLIAEEMRNPTRELYTPATLCPGRSLYWTRPIAETDELSDDGLDGLLAEAQRLDEAGLWCWQLIRA